MKFCGGGSSALEVFVSLLDCRTENIVVLYLVSNRQVGAFEIFC